MNTCVLLIPYHLQAESPFDAANLKIKGLLLSSCCLERNSDKMFELWSDLLAGAFKTSEASPETSIEALVLRLGDTFLPFDFQKRL